MVRSWKPLFSYMFFPQTSEALGFLPSLTELPFETLSGRFLLTILLTKLPTMPLTILRTKLPTMPLTIPLTKLPTKLPTMPLSIPLTKLPTMPGPKLGPKPGPKPGPKLGPNQPASQPASPRPPGQRLASPQLTDTLNRRLIFHIKHNVFLIGGSKTTVIVSSNLAPDFFVKIP